jgi:hypothetical protein
MSESQDKKMSEKGTEIVRCPSCGAPPTEYLGKVSHLAKYETFRYGEHLKGDKPGNQPCTVRRVVVHSVAAEVVA